jgi:lysophospholipase L1-like esterase
MRRGLSLALAGACGAASLLANSPMIPIAASDPGFRYKGSFDRSEPAPVVIWAGSRVSVDFSGDALALGFGAATGQNFFSVSVDGAVEIVGVPEGAGHRFVWPRPLAAGWHRLEIFKRSEADAGHVAFRGIELAPGAAVRAAAAPAYRLRLQFIGDSITVGANNEDGAVDQWEDRRTHNHALSYGHLVSQALQADHRAVAVSGMGVCEGFVPMHAGETWDKLYPRDRPGHIDLRGWVPDVVCVNLGENDDAFTRANGRPFPSGYTAGYVALVRAVRAAWPEAHIVLLRGGMWGGAQSPELRSAWEAAVRELETADPRISHYVFSHWSQQHPRVSDHRAMADELLRWLKSQSWARAYL